LHGLWEFDVSKEMSDFERVNSFIERFERSIDSPAAQRPRICYTGVDLGTACIVLAVLDEERRPVAGAYRYADVVRDGMVVDYLNAIRIVGELKAETEAKLGTELLYAAAAIPPGTAALDGGAVKNVVRGAGFVLTALPDEPTAANEVLKIKNGAVVDVGGGTTGIAVLKDGNVTYTADEATGGAHFSLVISGAYKLRFEEAELCKRDPARHKELLPVLTPVIQKVAAIVSAHIKGRDVQEIALVGGTACLTGMEDVLEKEIGIAVRKPRNPLFVTPLGIALRCGEEEME
jgi:ethanolamine utilization protein EutJ